MKFQGVDAVQLFLKNLRIQLCFSSETGVSGHELFVTFNMQGYGDPRQLGNKAVAGDSLRVKIKSFRRPTQAIARHTVDDADKVLFLHNSAKMPRMVGLGTISHVPMPAFHVEVGRDVQQRIAKEILRSQGRRKLTDVQKILVGKMRFRNPSSTAWVRQLGSTTPRETRMKLCLMVS